MPTSIDDYLILLDDSYRPTVAKNSLQQWDNYGIYSFYCVDRPFDLYSKLRFRQYTDLGLNGIGAFWGISEDLQTFQGLQQDFVAVQAFSPYPIEVDFDAIIRANFDEGVYTATTGTLLHQWDDYGSGIEPWENLDPLTPSAALIAALAIADASIVNQLDQRFVSPPAFQRRFGQLAAIWIARIKEFTLSAPCPSYLNLIIGYPWSGKTKPTDQPSYTPMRSGKLRISYYRQNKLESIPGLVTIDWLVYDLAIIANIEISLPIFDPVFGTVSITSIDPLLANDCIAQISSQPALSGEYSWGDTLNSPGVISNLLTEWKAIHLADLASTIDLQNALVSTAGNYGLNFAEVGIAIKAYQTIYKPNTLRILAASNNYWNTQTLMPTDLNPDLTHPLFTVDNQRAYDWHIKPQPDNSRGDLIMDSPRLIEIHLTLEAAKYAMDDIDPTLPRVANLGYLIERLAAILGLRLKADGTIDRDREKKKYVRKILENPNFLDNEYGGNSWGEYGMIFKRRITQYNKYGRQNDPYHVVHDLPQYLQALQSDIDAALSLQHGTQIRSENIDGGIDRYPNQLALILDLSRRIQAIELYSEKSYNLNIVSSAEIRGLYGALGVPISQKFIAVKNFVGLKATRLLPYFEWQKGKDTIASRFTTLEINLGIVMGILLPKSQSEKQKILNPFNFFKPKDK